MPANSVPFDIDVERKRLERRQKLIDQIGQSVLQGTPGQMVAGRYVGATPLTAVGQVVSAYLGQQQQDQLAKDEEGLKKQYNQGLQTEVERYMGKKFGKPGEMQQLPAGQAGPPQLVGAETADPKRAAIEAVVSSYPQLQALGMADLKSLAAAGIDVEKLLPYAAAESIPGMIQDGASAFRPKQNTKTVGDIVYDDQGRVVQLKGAQPETETIGGDFYQRSPSTGGLRKLDNATKVTVSPQVNVVNKGTSALAEKLAGTAAKDFEAASEAAQSAKHTLDSIAKVRSLGDTFTGPAANAAMFVGQLANAMGAKVDTAKLANSETLESESAQLWIQLMNQAGGSRGLVKEESDRIARSVPSLVHTPQGRQQLLQMLEDRAQKTVSAAERKRAALIRAGQADDPTKYFEDVTAGGLEGVSPASSPLPSAAPTVSNW